jgi:hypothetical protein
VDVFRSASRVTSFLHDLLFSRPETPLPRGATRAVLAGLFAAGVAHWFVFFDAGEMSFRGGGWPTEHAYYSVLQEAVRTFTMPYHIEPPIQGTDRFLATHETVASPQLLLLRYMSVGDFIVANTVIAYAAGFWACLVIRRRYALTLLPFLLLWLLVNFNGYITARLAAGQSTWTGYFLVPFYCYYVLRLCDTGATARVAERIALKLALVLFVMNLQGSFRMYVWHVLFLALVAAFNRKYFRPLALAATFSLLLSCAIIVVNLMTYLNGRHIFLTGYPTIAVLLQSFVSVEAFCGERPAAFFRVGWWEYDIFTGALGLAAVIGLGVCLRWSPPAGIEGTEYRQLDWPIAVTTICSLGAFYAPVAVLTLPFLNSEGIPSRFIITPFLLLLIVSCIRLSRLLESGAMSSRSLTGLKLLSLVGVIETCFELAAHSKAWAVRRWDRFYPELETGCIALVNRTDPLYEWTVQGAIAVSAVSLIVWTAHYARQARSYL